MLVDKYGVKSWR